MGTRSISSDERHSIVAPDLQAKQLASVLRAVQTPGSGLEIDLSRVSGASAFDEFEPSQLDQIERQLESQMCAKLSPATGVIYTGGLGRFRTIGAEAAEAYRLERQDDYYQRQTGWLPGQMVTQPEACLKNCVVLCGTGQSWFAECIGQELGLPVMKSKLSTFANSEFKPIIPESVRGADVFLVQRFPGPVNEYLMATILTMDALRRASARSINLVMPYYPYGRQDRRGGGEGGRTSVSASVVSKMLVGAGLKNIFTIDIHAAQTEGFFDSGFHNLSGKALILQSLKKRFAGRDVLVAFPDEGEAKRNEDDGLTDKLRVVFGPRVAFAQFSKTRGAEANSIARSELLTKVDPTGRSAVIFDDLLDTGGTALKSAEELKRKGVREVVLAMTHMVASQNAIERAKAARVEVNGEQVPTVDAIYTTDSLPISAPRGGFVHVTSLAPLYAEVIRRVCTGDRHASLRELGEVFSGLNGRGSLGTIH